MPQKTIEKSKKNFNLSSIPREARPFYFKAGKRAIFFIHGFSDSLCRVNGFAKFLASKGITTKGILLPGHAQTWQELEQSSPEDWYAAVEKGILDLAREKKEIYIVGISFGGNLGLKFAAEHPGIVKGIVAIEAPMKLKRQSFIKLGIRFYEQMGWPYWNKRYLKKVGNPEADSVFQKGVHDRMPVRNIKQIVRFLGDQEFLAGVTCDVMAIQSKHSNLITRNSARLLVKSVKSKRTEVLYVDNAYHALVSESEKRKIFFSAVEFFGINL